MQNENQKRKHNFAKKISKEDKREIENAGVKIMF